MDRSVWELTYEDIIGDDDSTQLGPEYNVMFYQRHDVIEEEAQNEKACIQVLKIMIPKANKDIEELEQNLVSLQTELACVEDEELSEICCSALREKINGVEVALRGLRKKSANAIQLQSLVPRRPAEKLQDILKELLRKHYKVKDKPPEFIDEGLKSDAAAYVTEHYEGLMQNQSDSDTVKQSRETISASGLVQKKPEADIVKESRETIFASEMWAIMNSSPDRQEPDYAKRIKPTPIDTVDQGPDLTLVADSSFEEKELVTINPGPELILVADSSDEEKKFVTEDLDEATREIEAIEQEPISMDAKLKESNSSKEKERSSSEPAVATPKPSLLRPMKFSEECVSVVKNLCKSDMKGNQITEVAVATATKEDSTAAKDLHPKEDQSLEKKDEPQNGIVEYTSIDAFIERAAVNARNTASKSDTTTSSTTENGDCDSKERVVEIRRRPFGRVGITDLKYDLASQLGLRKQDTGISIDPYPPKGNINQSLQNLIPNGKSQPVIGKPEINESPKAVVGFKTSHLSFDQKPQSPRPKKKSQSESESESMKGQLVSPTKRKHPTPTLSTYKRQKPDTNEDTICLNELIFKNQKKLTPTEALPKENCASIPVTGHSLAQSQGNKIILNASANTKELMVDLKFSVPPDSDPKATMPISDLTHLKVKELKDIAKDLKISGISKLKKQELVDCIEAKRKELPSQNIGSNCT